MSKYESNSSSEDESSSSDESSDLDFPAALPAGEKPAALPAGEKPAKPAKPAALPAGEKPAKPAKPAALPAVEQDHRSGRESLRAEAKALGLKGYSRWKKQQLVDEIALAKADPAALPLPSRQQGEKPEGPVDLMLNSLKLADVKKAAANAGIKLSKYSKEIGKSRPKKLSELKDELKSYVESHNKV